MALQALADKCRGSFYHFVKTFWSVVVSQPMIDNWHIAYVCSAAQECVEAAIDGRTDAQNLVINVPPGTSKSTIISQMLTAWAWTRKPSLRHISSSHTDALATRDVMLTRDIVLSQKYRKLFPDVKLRPDATGKSYLRTTSGGTRYATSTNATPTGEHADIRTIDDPLGKAQSYSSAEREQAIRHIEALATRTTDPSRITPTIMVMQRLHVEDPTAYYLSLGLPTRHICLPAELTDGAHAVLPADAADHYVCGLLDPVRLPREALDNRRRELGGEGYAGEYLQNPMLAMGLLYDPFKIYDVVPREAWMKTWAIVDVADTGKDYLCCIIADERPTGIYLREVIYTQKSVEFTAPAVADACASYGVDELIVEANNAGRLFALDVERRMRVGGNFTTRVRTFTTSSNKEARIFSRSVEVNNSIIMPVGWLTMWPEFGREITQRAKVGRHAHDDGVDALTALVEHRFYANGVAGTSIDGKELTADNFKSMYGLL